MRSRSPLALMEQLVMVLVFALAAALCVQAFALSDHISRTSEARDQAALLAQNAAEMLKSTRGDLEEASGLMGGQVTQDVWSVYYDQALALTGDPETAAYEVAAQRGPSGQAGLGRADIYVYETDAGAPLVSLEVAWQEVDGNAE